MTRFLKSSILLGMLIAASGCYNKQFIKPNTAQIENYMSQHSDLSSLDKSCIEEGRFEVGMGQDAVRFLLGEPKKIEIVQQPWAKQEKWVYVHGRDKKEFYMEDKGVVAIEEGK